MDRDGLVRAIASAKASSAYPVPVAIDGRSGSGTSTLAAQLAPELGASVYVSTLRPPESFDALILGI